jgi:CO dehydrogenase nickel-insertion accessory protein CooC1
MNGVKSVSVKKRLPPEEALEMEIEIRGQDGAGKTLIAAMLQETLEYAGFKNITVVCAVGDAAKTRERLKRINLRDQRCLNTHIRILDEDKPIIKENTSQHSTNVWNRLLNTIR